MTVNTISSNKSIRTSKNVICMNLLLISIKQETSSCFKSIDKFILLFYLIYTLICFPCFWALQCPAQCPAVAKVHFIANAKEAKVNFIISSQMQQRQKLIS